MGYHLSDRLNEIRRYKERLAYINDIAHCIAENGYNGLLDSEESALSNNPEFRKTVEKRVNEIKEERRRQEEIAEEKRIQLKEDEDIMSKKRPIQTIRSELELGREFADLEKGAILVVDDKEDELDKLFNIVSKLELPVHRATNKEDALNILRQYPITMLITDIVLPMYRLSPENYIEWEAQSTTKHKLLMYGISQESVQVTKTRIVEKETVNYSEFAGFKLLDEARGLIPWLPVIIVSRYADLDMARHAIGSKVQDIFSKQTVFCNPEELLKSIRKNMIPTQQRITSLGREEFLKFLKGASEETFTLKVVIPLFYKLGYHGICYTHGPNECGIDIIFYDVDRIGIRRYMGAQIKANVIHKDVGKSTSDSIITILQQIQQAFESTFILSEKKELELDRIFVISSKDITQPACDYIRKTLMGKVYGQHIDFMDANRIADLIL